MTRKIAGEEVLKSHDGHLVVYGSQWNIAEEIVASFKLQEDYQKINLFIVGPSSVVLKEQTYKDVEEFLNSVIQGNFVMHSSLVSNSSSVEDNGADFLERLKKYPKSHLHLLIHDEAHWGIAKNSNLNKFLNKVVTTLQGIEKPNFRFLMVSATPEVITEVEKGKKENTDKIKKIKEIPKVEWAKLAEEDKAHFYVESYVSVENIKYEGKYVKDSDIIENYNQALIDNVDTVERRVLQAIADNKPVIIKFNERDSIKAMTKEINATVEQLKLDPILILDATEPIYKQMPENYGLQKRCLIGDLENIGCMILACDTVEIGVRIPTSTAYFDIRSRYKEMNMHNHIIQDIGRCAGHFKETTILIAEDKLKNFIEKGKFKRYHQLLSFRKIVADAMDLEVYSALSEYAVILCAEPQIGKTGALLALIKILNDKIAQQGNQTVQQQMQIDNPNQPSEQSKLSQIATKFRNLANTNREEYITILSDIGEWSNFHANIQENTGFDSLSKYLAGHIVNNCNIKEGDVIVDCGCGTMNLAHHIDEAIKQRLLETRSTEDGGEGMDASQDDEEPMSEDDLNLIYVGVDLCIKDLEVELDHVQVETLKADMKDLKVEPEPTVHCIVFSLSLYENEIIDYIKWAMNSIKRDGVVIILDWKWRLSKVDFNAIIPKSFLSLFSPTLDGSKFGEKFTMCVMKHRKITAKSFKLGPYSASVNNHVENDEE
ncbi:replication protein E1 [Acrasis kona]|uniref:Replication protein E1 n=1 Tax=Acrasis kona TaxID=1008807 RepID=A0AAW2ZDM2_9EUKA